jgi:hypothetical protein
VENKPLPGDFTKHFIRLTGTFLSAFELPGQLFYNTRVKAIKE